MKRLISALALGVLTAGLLVVSSSASPGIGASEVTIDFSHNSHGDLDSVFYRSEGLVLSPERCGSAGCTSWFVAFIQGDNALVGNPLLGGVYATFTRPVSALSLNIAPGIQGSAHYTLKAYSASGQEIGSQSQTVIQDSGDPNTGPAGYFTMSLPNLSTPARSFTLTNTFLGSTFGGLGPIEFGVSSIIYRHWGQPQ